MCGKNLVSRIALLSKKTRACVCGMETERKLVLGDCLDAMCDVYCESSDN